MELNIESLTKHYGDLCALEDFTVCLRPGVYGLLGPNGAGKSTLMNLLTDTVKREAGSIRYNGKEILELPCARRATSIPRTFTRAPAMWGRSPSLWT